MNSLITNSYHNWLILVDIFPNNNFSEHCFVNVCSWYTMPLTAAKIHEKSRGYKNKYIYFQLIFISRKLRNLLVLTPYNIGQGPCKLSLIRLPSLCILYQRSIAPSLGYTTRPTLGNPVPPPSTVDNYKKMRS